MNKKFGLAALAVVMIITAACTDPSKIQVEDVSLQDFRMVSSSVFNVDVGVEVINQSSHKAAIAGGEAEIILDGVAIAEIVLRDKVIVPRRTEGVYTVPLSVRLNGGIIGLMMMGGLNEQALNRAVVNGKVALRGGWAKKSFCMENVPLSTVLRQAGFDSKDILDQL